jgi:hypothetical protein
MGEFLHRDFLAPERKPFADRTDGSEQREFSYRKIPLFETKPHFFADGTRRAYNSHMWRIHISKTGHFPAGRGNLSRFFHAGNRIVGESSPPIVAGASSRQAVCRA